MSTAAPFSSTAGPTSADAARWAADWQTLLDQLDHHFARSETRAHMRAYLTGLLSPIGRKNGWHLAEHAGHATPYGIQHLLDGAEWDADAVRDDLQVYVRQHLGHSAGVLVIDEMRFLKKGTYSVGVGIQSRGLIGKQENCQVGVFLVYVSPHGQTLYDRALYLPPDWAENPKRRAAAGVPTGVRFATKPQLAKQLVLRALASGVPVAWVTGDAVYGKDDQLRGALEEREQPYAFTIYGNEALWGGRRRARKRVNAEPATAWERISCGAGSRGPRLYDWLRIPVNHPADGPGQRWLVARRSLTNLDDPPSFAYYLVFAPAQTSLATLAQVIGERWGIEGAFEERKEAVGLGQYEVRSWRGWYRHITLAMWAHAFLTITHARTRTPVAIAPTAAEGNKGGPTPSSMAAFKRHRGLSSA
jgi:SRSO17 transposase